MQHIQGKMHSLEKAMEEDHMGKRGANNMENRRRV